MKKRISEQMLLSDEKALALRAEYFAKLADKYTRPRFQAHLKLTPLIRSKAYDYFDYLAERRREADIAKQAIYNLAVASVAKAYGHAAGSMKLGGDPPPRIDAMCRSVIPLNGLIKLYGDYFVEGATEAFCREQYCHNYIPLDESYDAVGGCWAMHPGASGGWCDVRPREVEYGNEARFYLPDDDRHLTEDRSYDTETTHIDDYSRLAFLTRVEGAGESNVFDGPHHAGFRTVPRSNFDDPVDVHDHPLEELEELLLEMINEIRAWNGVAPVEMHPELRDVAREHAQLMNDQYCYSKLQGCNCTGWIPDCSSTDTHQAPSEPSFSDRLSALGFSRIAENVSWSFYSSAPIKGAAEGWDNSCRAGTGAAHREHQLGTYTHVGIGIARSERTHIEGHTGQYYTFTCDYGAH